MLAPLHVLALFKSDPRIIQVGFTDHSSKKSWLRQPSLLCGAGTSAGAGSTTGSGSTTRSGSSTGAGSTMDPAHLKIRDRSGAITDAGPKSGSGAGSRSGSITALL